MYSTNVRKSYKKQTDKQYIRKDTNHQIKSKEQINDRI